MSPCRWGLASFVSGDSLSTASKILSEPDRSLCVSHTLASRRSAHSGVTYHGCDPTVRTCRRATGSASLWWKPGAASECQLRWAAGPSRTRLWPVQSEGPRWVTGRDRAVRAGGQWGPRGEAGCLGEGPGSSGEAGNSREPTHTEAGNRGACTEGPRGKMEQRRGATRDVSGHRPHGRGDRVTGKITQTFEILIDRCTFIISVNLF